MDFSVIETLDHFKTVISRDFGEKAPTEMDILERLKAGKYKSRFELCRDLALNLYWVNRYALTMYEERPTRWGDLPRQREDVFLPACKPWDSNRVADEIQEGYAGLPLQWKSETEDEAFGLVLNGLRSKHSAGADQRAIGILDQRLQTLVEAADPAGRDRCQQVRQPRLSVGPGNRGDGSNTAGASRRR